MSNIRKNGIVGLVENKGLIDIKLHFSEWWNGEGLDFSFYDDTCNDKRFELHIDEIEALVVACIAAGMVDLKHCKKKAKELIEQSKQREQVMVKNDSVD